MFRTLTAAAIGAAVFSMLQKQRSQQRDGAPAGSPDGAPVTPAALDTPGFVLESREIPGGGRIDARFEFNGFDCSGANQSPALDWTGVPEGAKSFALTLFDPDAPSGSGWWHWVVIDIPAHVTGLSPDAGASDGKLLPTGARQLRNDYGQFGFGGVCPPRGDPAHRYVFTLHALKVEKLEIPDDASCALAGFMLNANAIGRASFSARYGRPKG